MDVMAARMLGSMHFTVLSTSRVYEVTASLVVESLRSLELSMG